MAPADDVLQSVITAEALRDGSLIAAARSRASATLLLLGCRDRRPAWTPCWPRIRPARMSGCSATAR